MSSLQSMRDVALVSILLLFSWSVLRSFKPLFHFLLNAGVLQVVYSQPMDVAHLIPILFGLAFSGILCYRDVFQRISIYGCLRRDVMISYFIWGFTISVFPYFYIELRNIIWRQAWYLYLDLKIFYVSIPTIKKTGMGATG